MPAIDFTDMDTECQFRILELTPEHYDATICTLCGQSGENVDWYRAISPEAHNTHGYIHTALKALIEDWPDDLSDLSKYPDGGATLHLASQDIAERVDRIAFQHHVSDHGELTVCPACVSATSKELRCRIRKHADWLDEAGYSAPYGPASDDLTDSSLRDQGLWVRRHIGYDLVIDEGLPV